MRRKTLREINLVNIGFALSFIWKDYLFVDKLTTLKHLENYNDILNLDTAIQNYKYQFQKRDIGFVFD